MKDRPLPHPTFVVDQVRAEARDWYAASTAAGVCGLVDKLAADDAAAGLASLSPAEADSVVRLAMLSLMELSARDFEARGGGGA